MSKTKTEIKLNPEAVLEAIEQFEAESSHTKNPYNRGFYCGMIHAFNMMTGGDVQPVPLNAPYSDIACSEGEIGYEAIHLLAEAGALDLDGDSFRTFFLAWQNRSTQLIETWHANTTSAAMKSVIEKAGQRRQPVFLVIGSDRHVIKNTSDLLDLDKVQDAMKDGDGWLFYRLFSIQNDLFSELTDKNNHKKNIFIGTWEPNCPKWLGLNDT